MSPAKVLLTAVLLLGLMSVPALAQDTKPSLRKPAPVSWNPEREPQNEVEQQLAAAARRGEVVLGSCLENCVDDPDEKLPAGFERGNGVNLPMPRYPAIARAAHVSGTVEVQVIVDVDGKVIAAVAVSGHPLLRASSVQAARDSVFLPTKWEGRPVKVIGVIKYNFVTQ